MYEVINVLMSKVEKCVYEMSIRTNMPEYFFTLGIKERDCVVFNKE